MWEKYTLCNILYLSVAQGLSMYHLLALVFFWVSESLLIILAANVSLTKSKQK